LTAFLLPAALPLLLKNSFFPQHKLPSFDLPEYRKEHRAKYGLPRVQFRFFDLHDVSSSELSLPPSDSIERFILEEQVRTILSLDYRHRKDCVRSLLNLSPSGRYPVDYIIMEVTLGELFRLPCPNAKFLFYFSVLLEFSKLPELGFSSLIALSFEMLYEKLEWMEVECRERFSLWFAWHLSNNSYKWHWDDWKNCDRKCEPAQYGFIRSALQKCVKLSYHERIHGVLPEDLHHLMPSAPRPCFELFSLADTEEFASVEGLADSQVHPASPVVRRVFEAVRKKEPSNFIRSLLQEVSREHISINDRYKSVEEFQVYLFTQCLLLAGSKSYSHFISALERYMKLLNEISQLEDCKNQIIYALFSFWESSAQMLAILMDRLVTYRVIDPTSVINCLFSYDFLENHEKLGLWDILTATLNKMVARTDQMKLDIELVEGEISYLEHGKKVCLFSAVFASRHCPFR
jgi:nuclear cap-binding protein subunit 1